MRTDARAVRARRLDIVVSLNFGRLGSQMSFAFVVAGIITGITFVEASSQKVHGEICKIIGTGIRERREGASCSPP
jgi:hypothetical protein